MGSELGVCPVSALGSAPERLYLNGPEPKQITSLKLTQTKTAPSPYMEFPILKGSSRSTGNLSLCRESSALQGMSRSTGNRVRALCIFCIVRKPFGNRGVRSSATVLSIAHLVMLPSGYITLSKHSDSPDAKPPLKNRLRVQWRGWLHCFVHTAPSREDVCPHLCSCPSRCSLP